MLLDRPKLITTRIVELLRQRIRSRHYAPGARLPSEAELSRELGVSRATLRTALARLAAEGLILRRHGEGTFVNQHAGEATGASGGMLNYWQLIEASGRTPSIETISLSYRPVTPAEAAALQIPGHAPALSLVRLFRADEIPFILALNVIPRSLLLADLEELTGNIPLEQFVRRFCGRGLAYGVYDIRATRVDELAAAILARDPGEPLLQLTSTFYDQENQPLVHGQSYYDDSLLSLSFVQSW